MREFLRSFQNAWRGIRTAADGRNFKVQLLAAVWAMVLCWVGQAGRGRWAAVTLACVMVLGAEAFNSAIEQLCNRVTSEWEEPIRRVKDLAAGGVLLCAIGALGVAVLAFGDVDFLKRVLDRILYEGQAWSVFLILGLPVAALSVALPMKKKKQAALPEYKIEEIKEEDGDH